MNITLPEEQKAALDVIIRMALTNDKSPMTSELGGMLGTLPRDAGRQVATIMIMLAGAAVQDDDEWRELLHEHFEGSLES